MHALAQAVIAATTFIALSSDDIVDPDAAVRALEDVMAILTTCSAEERAMMHHVLLKARAQAIAAHQSSETLDFYDVFIEAIAELSH
jgi:predicted ATP-grasp superfamily ATP-dependent carboligase